MSVNFIIMVNTTRQGVLLVIALYNDCDRLQAYWKSWAKSGAKTVMLIMTADDKATEDALLEVSQEWEHVSDSQLHICMQTVHRHGSCCRARNHAITHAVDFGYEYVWIMDSDVKPTHATLEGLLQPFSSARLRRLGMVGAAQSNAGGFPVESSEGLVHELTNECLLTKVEMWMHGIRYPDINRYYSGDSWAAKLARMSGWFTAVVPDVNAPYLHEKHGSQRNPEMEEVRQADIKRWEEHERQLNVSGLVETTLQGPEFGGFGGLHTVSTLTPMMGKPRFQVLEPDPKIQHPEDARVFTPDSDLKIVMTLFHKQGGHIAEIGANEGVTTLQLSRNFPSRCIYAYEPENAGQQLIEGQKNEAPDEQTRFQHALGRENVLCFAAGFEWENAPVGIRNFFIDGDHTWIGLDRDFSNILAYLRAEAVRCGEDVTGMLVFHDYVPLHRHTCQWLQVGHYLREKLATTYPVTWIQESSVAYLTIDVVCPFQD